tara:strand:+ start:293 stop:1411 length:1119 start_codon:yes stop_codon:yes gene_type:complete
MDNLPELSLYIHLPWCDKKCPYCDFNISTDSLNGSVKELFNTLKNDLLQSNSLINHRAFKSIYFGGGTPSKVPTTYIKDFLNFLHIEFNVVSNCEISFEANPKDLTLDYIAGLKDSGINRLSVGIQSFDDKYLCFLGRNHNASDSLRALKLLSESELTGTIDLIYGGPNSNSLTLKNDLKIFLNAGINHLSLYQLNIEPNTIFYKKRPLMPTENEIEKAEIISSDLLVQNNFNQYEISSWSKEDSISVHNQNYWKFGDYLGIGPGASSKIYKDNFHHRLRKRRSIKSYINDTKPTHMEKLQGKELDFDLAINILRNKSGIDDESLETNQIKLSKRFIEKYKIGVELGYFQKGKLKTTEKGFRFLNDAVSLFS